MPRLLTNDYLALQAWSRMGHWGANRLTEALQAAREDQAPQDVVYFNETPRGRKWRRLSQVFYDKTRQEVQRIVQELKR